MSFFCHTCGKDIDMEVLGLGDREAKCWHNTVHQRDALRDGFDRLEELAEKMPFQAAWMSEEIRKCVASMERDEYIEPSKEESAKTT